MAVGALFEIGVLIRYLGVFLNERSVLASSLVSFSLIVQQILYLRKEGTYRQCNASEKAKEWEERVRIRRGQWQAVVHGSGKKNWSRSWSLVKRANAEVAGECAGAQVTQALYRSQIHSTKALSNHNATTHQNECTASASVIFSCVPSSPPAPGVLAGYYK